MLNPHPDPLLQVGEGMNSKTILSFSLPHLWERVRVLMRIFLLLLLLSLNTLALADTVTTATGTSTPPPASSAAASAQITLSQSQAQLDETKALFHHTEYKYLNHPKNSQKQLTLKTEDGDDNAN